MMFQNILKWTFKILVGETEKEISLHLDGDTPIEAVEQVALQMIAYCGKVKEANAAAKVASSETTEPLLDAELPKSEQSNV